MSKVWKVILTISILLNVVLIVLYLLALGDLSAKDQAMNDLLYQTTLSQ